MKETPGNIAAYAEELDRIVTSEAFRSSDTLRRLLLYLGKKSLSGQADDLKEYTVGVEAFGKPEGYDPQYDASVRIQAGKLRQKLEDYFRTDGFQDQVIVSFPKGHFRLEFELRAKPQAEQSLEHGLRRWRTAAGLLAAALVLCSLGLAYLLLTPSPGDGAVRVERWTPALHAIWDPVLNDEKPILIGVGTPLFTKIGLGFYRDPKINEWDQATVPARLDGVRQALGATTPIPAPIYTGIGEATAAFLLCRLLSSDKDLQVKRSSALTWDDVKENNVIFLGCEKYNPQLRDLLSQQDFFMDGSRIVNRRPRKGEPPSFAGTCPPNSAYVVEDYALITKLPSVQGRQLIAFAASSTEGTWAASEFITSEPHASEFVSAVAGPSRVMPASYQVVIRARFRSQVPFEMAMVAKRSGSE